MQRDRIRRSVLGVGLLLILQLQGSNAATIEELLRAQDSHEALAHADFVEWARGAQSKLADRVTVQKERVDELTGAIASYSGKADELKSSTKKNGMEHLNALSQDQRLQLIEIESDHWRSVHTKEATERLLKADKELLAGVQDALRWEKQALAQHQGVRQKLIALVHERRLEQPIDEPLLPPVPVAAVMPAAFLPLVPVAAAVPVPPLAQAPPVANRVLQKAPIAKHAATPTAVLPQAGVAQAITSRLVKRPVAPILGITSLPALEMLQADSHQVAVPDEVEPSLSNLFSALQGASHPVAPPSSEPPTELLTPMLPHGAPLDAKKMALNPLLSLAGMGSASATPVSPLAALAPTLATTAAVPTLPKATVAAPAPKAAVVAPKAAVVSAHAPKADVVAPKAAVVAAPAPKAVVVAPKAAVVAPKAAVVASPEVKDTAPKQVPATVKKIVHAAQSAQPHKAPPAPAKAKTLSKVAPHKAAPQPPVTQNLVAPKASVPPTPAKKTSQVDPEEALMAIMTGSDEAEPAETEVHAATPSKPKAKPAKVATAFLAMPRITLPKAAPKVVPVVSAPKDPEDALMEVMTQNGGIEDIEKVAPATRPVAIEKVAPAKKAAKHVQAKVAPAKHVQVKRAAKVAPTKVAQAVKAKVAQAVKLQHVAPLPTPSKGQAPKAQKKLAVDSEDGIVQSFIQEVTDLDQGEPGASQVVPAAPAASEVESAFQAAPAQEQESQETQESEQHLMNSFVQDVSRLSQGEPSKEEKSEGTPSTETGLALSSDLQSLMGLGGPGAPASFLQLAQRGHRAHSPRSDMAAASMIKDLDASEVSKRLARKVAQGSVASNIQMLSALNAQLGTYKFQWTCTQGSAAAHSLAVLQLAETGTSLLMAERATVASLSAQLRDSQATSAQLRAEFVGKLEETLARSYEAAGTELENLSLPSIRTATPIGASSMVALESVLRSDAAAAKHLASTCIDKDSEYVRLGDELLHASAAKDSELKKARRVLSDAQARAATTRHAVAKEPGCAEAVRSSGLMAAVYKALHILSD